MPTNLFLRTLAADGPKPGVKQSSTSITHWLPNTNGGGQDNASTIYPCKMIEYEPGALPTSHIQSYTEPGVAHYGWVKAFVSPRLTAQTISGTFIFNADFMEGSVAQNMFPRLYIYVWKGDNSGVRGVLYANGNSNIESNTTIGSQQEFFNLSVSPVNAQDGDVIVVEVMWWDNNTKTVAYDHGFGYNGAVGYSTNLYFAMTLIWADQFMDQII